MMNRYLLKRPTEFSKMMDNEMYNILLDEVQLVPVFEDVLISYLKMDNADVYQATR